MNYILFAHFGGGAFGLALVAAMLILAVCVLGKGLQK
jgi:hypothetical protein